MQMLYIMNEIKSINSFVMSSILAAKQCKIDFHLACNWKGSLIEKESAELQYNIRIHHIDFNRNPYHFSNIKAYKQLYQLMSDEQFEIVHCNTPIGGVIGRLVAHQLHIKTIIYQAHGFHFYKNAPLINSTLYYSIEYLLSRITDILITINHEDYNSAQSFPLKSRESIYYVPGVGIDLQTYKYQRNLALREQLGLSQNDFVLISMGDLISRKNYAIVIQAIAKLNNPNIHYLICGEGPELNSLQKLTNELNLQSQIHFLGYRIDIITLLQLSDIFILSSIQEGLSRSVMEAMACGLPCIVSNIRGNVDLIDDKKGGFLCDLDADSFAQNIAQLINNPVLYQQMSQYNLNKIQDFDLNIVTDKLSEIYRAAL